MIYYLCNIITAKLKKLFRIILLFMMIACATKMQASNCIPAGTTVTLSRQSQIDSFPINYPGCDVVEGSLTISGDDIVNLNGLISIKRIDHDLRIENNSNLVNLIGLDSLKHCESKIIISNNKNLSNLNGLNSLDTTGYLYIYSNENVVNFIGLQNIKWIGGLQVDNNRSLINFHGMETLVFIDNFDIRNNLSLKNLIGFDRITRFFQTSFIVNNPSLIDLYGLHNLSRVLYTGLSLYNNNALLNLDGLSTLKSIGSILIQENDNLADLTGLNSIDTIGSLTIQLNQSLENLHGLENLKYNIVLSIHSNPSLCNMNGINTNLRIESIEISSNIKLSCCKIIDTIIRNNPTITNISIYNNATGCNDTTEIRTITTQNCCSTKYTLLKDTICNGEQVIFNSQILKNTGTYYDTFVNIGNDSIVILELKVFNKSYQIKTLNFCIGQSFTLSNGRIITTTGIYKDTIPNFCDSIIEYRLIFLNNIIVNQNATICQGKTYTLPKGNIVQTTGIYKDTLRSTFNCDSIVITNLTITKPIPFVNNATICKGKNYILPNGNSVNNTGTYYDTIRKPNTCDSIVITNLTVTKPIPFLNNVSICKGKNYVLPNGNSVNNAGTYYDTIRKPNTCDSIVITNLLVNPYLQSSQTATTCLGKTYTLPSGKTVTQSGIYKDTIRTTFGCDSIVTTNLSITNPTPTQKSDSICEGKIYTLPSGKQVTNTGIYIDTIKKINTCDSVIITNLSVFQNTFSVSLKSVDTIDAGNAIELKPMYSNQPAIIWNWSPTSSLNCTTCEKPIATPSQNTQYSLKATAQNGCDDTAKTTIIVRQTEVYIPTAFSPNNDGINDDLTVFVNNPVAFHLVIFNRYDQKVFESVDVLNKWNGTYKNAECEVDNYVYVLDVTTANGKQHHKQGTITLLR